MSASIRTCSECICRSCLWYHSGRCPHGGCYDDLRARIQPWQGEKRTTWSGWNLPGEQDHRCRGGIFYPADRCEDYAPYDASKHIVETCLLANVERFQDGYIRCSMVDTIGCEECYKRFEEMQKDE